MLQYLFSDIIQGYKIAYSLTCCFPRLHSTMAFVSQFTGDSFPCSTRTRNVSEKYRLCLRSPERFFYVLRICNTHFQYWLSIEIGCWMIFMTSFFFMLLLLISIDVMFLFALGLFCIISVRNKRHQQIFRKILLTNN